uniref:Synapse associated protein 1 n=1 Tax=Latimeria chalumnae TaxID=7897 RepID=H3AYC1_LATCH
LTDFLLGVAVSATRKVSESVWETAQTIKKSVDENPIDNIIDKTILGDFKKEQEKFVKEQKSRKTALPHCALPPCRPQSNNIATAEQTVCIEKGDRRNFLRDPPAGVHFHFDFSHIAPVAMVMLQEDELLDKMRFELVPKLIFSFVFLHSSRFRCFLVLRLCCSSRTMGGYKGTESKLLHLILSDSPLSKTPPIAVKRKGNTSEAPGAEEVSTSPAGSEFVSDAYDTSVLNQEDLLKEMEQLGMSGKAELLQLEDDDGGDIPEWEKELQRELQEFEVVEEEEKNKVSEAWEKEIELMLQSDD